MNLAEIAACLGCESMTSEIQVRGASIDSRKAKPGDIFFCLPGERADGHEFARAAIDNGAVCVVATRDLRNLPAPLLKVEDATLALGKLAKLWRRQMSAKVICVTGTAGKTTLKEMLAPILAQDGKCAATPGNFNNQIGLPLTILNTDGDEKYLLLEAGISHEGDMEYLADICRPDLALILNIGEGHTDGLGNRGVAWHKTRLLQYLAPDGRALINADYPELVTEARKTGAELRFFANNAQGSDYGPCEKEAQGYTILRKGESIFFEKNCSSPAPTETLLAAVSMACELGIRDEQICAGLAQNIAPEHRYQILETHPYIIIDDSYNANPLSMQKSLISAASEAQRRKLPLIAVLGEMGELGSGAKVAHSRLGELLETIGPAAVFWKGQWFSQITDSYSGPIHHLGKASEFPQLLASAGLPEQALLFFKGSRLNRLEDYIGSLLSDDSSGRGDDVL